MHGAAGPISRIVSFDETVTLNLADSCPLSIPLAHPVSPALAERAAAARLDDVATIIYTSGTTGDPKGVVLSFENLVVQFEAIDRDFSVTERDRSLCFLPLSHAYERAWTFYILSKGAQNFYLDDPEAHPRGDAGGAADVHGQRAAPLREDLLDGAPQGEPGVGDETEAVPVGGEGRQPIRPREEARRPRGPVARGAARPGRQAGAPQDPGHRRRPEELLLGRAAPR